MTLDRLSPGNDAFISSIECEDKALRSHILDMGLTPGVEVTLIKTAPMGDPLEIRLRGYELTLRKDDAAKITITDIHDAHNCPRKNKKFKEIAHSQKGEEVKYKTHRKNKIPLKKQLCIALQATRTAEKQRFLTD